MKIRAYTAADLPQMIQIWNEIVEAGDAFPQEENLTPETGAAFFASQTRTAVAEENGVLYGLYILHPNNIGRCGHLCNASYVVRKRTTHNLLRKYVLPFPQSPLPMLRQAGIGRHSAFLPAKKR